MLFNINEQKVISSDIVYADSFFSKLKGLMFTNELKNDHGLILRKVVKVHTFFMQYPIDIFYISKDDVVVRIDENVSPWQVLKTCRTSEYVVETNAGVAKKTNTKVNDSVVIINKNAFKSN